jgi:uncharacterized protein with PIN domain
MVIDISALIAIFLEEPEADRFDEATAKAKTRLLPATCLAVVNAQTIAEEFNRKLGAVLHDLPARLLQFRGQARNPARL